VIKSISRHWIDVPARLAHAVPGRRRCGQSPSVEQIRSPDADSASFIGWLQTVTVEERVVVPGGE
jgi:hypothetical protein